MSINVVDNKHQLEKFLRAHLAGTLSDQEKLQLLGLLEEPEGFRQWSQLVGGLYSEASKVMPEIEEEEVESVITYILNYPDTAAPVVEDPIKLETVRRVHFLQSTWFRYAAAVILMVGIGAFLWSASRQKSQLPIVDTATADVPPGRDGAILTLADGSIVLLDTLQNGTIGLQGGAIARVVDGTLVYEANGSDIVYNTMSTPKGRQYRLTLPDGSQVWLNAASSIRYPTVFAGNERVVEVTGEVYFEVARQANMPFKVKADAYTEVEVLGTSFNINSYENEPSVKTTLIEGSVRVNAYAQVQQLSPGEQALVDSTAKTVMVMKKVDLQQVIAWKNGLFNFEGMRLREVMKQLERWFDIEVIYENGPPDVGFFGKLDRNVSLNTILEVFKEYGIKYKMEGRKLIVSS